MKIPNNFNSVAFVPETIKKIYLLNKRLSFLAVLNKIKIFFKEDHIIYLDTSLRWEGVSSVIRLPLLKNAI